jgi:hypothetical protein
MSILNRPSDGLLSVLLALRRAVLAYGPRPDSELIRLVAPSSVVPEGKPDLAKKTLNRWKQLGFFDDIDGVIHLNSRIVAIGSGDLSSLRAAVLRLVLANENNPAFTLEDDADHEGSKASDCTRAIAWTLSQDPYVFPAKYKGGVETLQDNQGVKPRPFANDTRWAGFSEWATFLGIGFATTKIGFVPDPAFAVRSILDEVFRGSAELPQAAFFAGLAESLPIVDGGRYRVAVESQVARRWRDQLATEISPSLSAAILTLEANNELRLEMRSDAPQRMLLGRDGRELRPVSHLVRLGHSDA